MKRFVPVCSSVALNRRRVIWCIRFFPRFYFSKMNFSIVHICFRAKEHVSLVAKCMCLSEWKEKIVCVCFSLFLFASKIGISPCVAVSLRGAEARKDFPFIFTLSGFAYITQECRKTFYFLFNLFRVECARIAIDGNGLFAMRSIFYT